MKLQTQFTFPKKALRDLDDIETDYEFQTSVLN